MNLAQLQSAETNMKAVLAQIATRKETLIHDQLSKGEQRLCVVCQVTTTARFRSSVHFTLFVAAASQVAAQ
jgi:hypothetical protein